MNKLDLNIDSFDLVPSKDWLYFKTGYHRYFKTDLKDTIEIKRKEYISSKYGLDFFHEDSGESVVILDNGNTLRCHYQVSIIEEYSREGKLVRQLPEEICNMTISDIALDKHSNIWIAEPTIHRIAQFDLITGEMKFHIIGDFNENRENSENNEFNHPEDITAVENFLYVSDMGNCRIARIDIDSKKVETYRQFEIPTWEYRRFKDYEIVRLDDGVYQL